MKKSRISLTHLTMQERRETMNPKAIEFRSRGISTHLISHSPWQCNAAAAIAMCLVVDNFSLLLSLRRRFQLLCVVFGYRLPHHTLDIIHPGDDVSPRHTVHTHYTTKSIWKCLIKNEQEELASLMMIKTVEKKHNKTTTKKKERPICTTVRSPPSLPPLSQQSRMYKRKKTKSHKNALKFSSSSRGTTMKTRPMYYD